SFRPQADADVTPPNLMQRRVAVSIRDRRRFGNWSGMGAGKTLSAILSTRVVGAKLTVICCPNAVVGGWAEQILNAFPDSEVVTKTWEPTWQQGSKKHRYLVMNYEQFQQQDSEANVVSFIAKHKVDFVAIDEIHFTKHRESHVPISKRKRLVQALV